MPKEKHRHTDDDYEADIASSFKKKLRLECSKETVTRVNEIKSEPNTLGESACAPIACTALILHPSHSVPYSTAEKEMMALRSIFTEKSPINLNSLDFKGTYLSATSLWGTQTTGPVPADTGERQNGEEYDMQLD